MIDLRSVLADISTLGPPFSAGMRHRANGADMEAGREADNEPHEEVIWFRPVRLSAPDDNHARRMVELHADFRGMPVGRHSASLTFQRYCHRICAVSVAVWVRHGITIDLAAANTSMRFLGGTPDYVAINEPRVIGGPAPRTIIRTVVDDHLLPIASVLRAQTGPGLGNLWGNIAAGFAGAFRNLSRYHPAGEMQRYATTLLTSRPELERGGSFRILDGPKGPRLQYDRKSCCHWYATPEGQYCSWCSRISSEERTQRFLENMAAE